MGGVRLNTLAAICSALIVAACVRCDEPQGLSLRQLLDNDNADAAGGGGGVAIPPPMHQLPSPQPIADPSASWYDRIHTLPAIDLHALNNDPRFDAAHSERIATNALDLARDIGATVLADSQKAAEVFSPLSIYSALSLLLLGASGTTFDELLRLMHFDTDAYLSRNPWKIHEEFGLLLEDVARVDGQNPTRRRAPTAWKVNRGPAQPQETAAAPGGTYRGDDSSVGDYRVTVANGLFVQNGFSLRADYRSAVLGIYRSNLKSMDFEKDPKQATDYINEWVNQKTEGKIPRIIGEQLSPKTQIVMASALYFNAMWEKTFYEGVTGPKNFYPDGLAAAPITVDMMANGGRFPFYDSKQHDCRIIGLPYKRNMTTMYIIQPNNSDRRRLRDLQARLTAADIEQMIARMQWETSIVLLPKMHISNQLNLKDVLHRMGARALFNVAAADLSLISNGRGAEPELALGQTFLAAPAPAVLASLTGASAPRRPPVPLPGDESSDDEPFIFTRHEDDDLTRRPVAGSRRRRRSPLVTYKVPSAERSAPSPLTMKSFILDKRITKTGAAAPAFKKARRTRRQVDLSASVKQLDRLREVLRQRQAAPAAADATRAGGPPSENAGLFVDEILHQVDLTVNEKGTEGGAATVTTLFRTGTDVVMRVETPFMFLIRHDETKLPLFYGAVFEPSSA